jgi:hypothetical protein
MDSGEFLSSFPPGRGVTEVSTQGEKLYPRCLMVSNGFRSHRSGWDGVWGCLWNV